MHRLLLASLVAAGVSSVSLSALAQTGAPTVATTRPTSNPSYADTGDALDPTGWSVAALLGFGVNNGVGIGIGARGGYTLDNHVYIGGTLIDHLPSGLNILLLGGEAGYDFEVGPVVIRAYGGLGFANASVSVGGVSASSNERRVLARGDGHLQHPVGPAVVRRRRRPRVHRQRLQHARPLWIWRDPLLTRGDRAIVREV